MSTKRITTPLLAAIAIGACAPIPNSEMAGNDADDLICRKDAPINSHVRITNCRPIDDFGIGNERISIEDIRRSTSPSVTSDAGPGNSGNAQTLPSISSTAEGSCGGNRGDD